MSSVRCFEMGFSALLDGSLWIKWASIFANVATCIAAIFAVVAVIIAYFQIQSSRQETRKSTAFNIYNQYLLLCISNPGLSDGMAKPDVKSLNYTQYKWFVSAMLFSFEQILDVQPEDVEWEKTIIAQIKIHKELLIISRTVREKEWSDKLHQLISKSIA